MRQMIASHCADAFRMLACGLNLTSERGSAENDLKAIKAYFNH